jgi:hypothetical protein
MMRERLVPLALAGALLAAAACDSSTEPSAAVPDSTTAVPTTVAGPDDPTTTVGSTSEARPQGFGGRLEFFGDCPALLDYMKTEATERVTPWGLGGGGRFFAEDGAATDDSGGAEEAGRAAPVAGEDFSGTNTQEAGVDEGDIVETDGRYVYAASTDGLRIVSVADADVVAEPGLPQGSHQLLLDGKRLVAVTSSWSGAPDTIVSLYDVTDPTNPSLLRRSHLEGHVVATRGIDGVARLVISTSFDQRLPFVQPDRFGLDEESALERNKEIIAESTIEDWLPRWFDEAGDGSFGPMRAGAAVRGRRRPRPVLGARCDLDRLDRRARRRHADRLGRCRLDRRHGVRVDRQPLHRHPELGLVVGRPPAPAGRRRDRGADATSDVAPDVEPGPPPTLIHQFRLDSDTGATYVASGEVEGRLLNQFAMSEHGGDLRVATTTDDWGRFGEQSESTVYVLRPDGTDLEQISSVTGLGKGEQIHSVRFIGDVGYVVTFRQIDPLYVLDLSDPENPVLDGELKIPGYSAYLHPVGEGLLLGVGQDATDEGRTTGTQLSLFDVSDPTDPQRISTLTIGGQSEVEWDHKAFLFWEPDGTIVLPVSPGWGDCPTGVDCLAKEITGAGGGVVVAELDGRELVARGTITHGPNNPRGCWNPLQRSIAIGDELVTVGLDQMKFSDRLTLEPRDSVSWGDPDDYGCYWYWD